MNVSLARIAFLLCLTLATATRADAAEARSSDQAPAAPQPELELVRELHADGGRVEREVRVDATGARIPDGRYRRWHPDGSLAEEGRFENGLRAGEWRTHFATGGVESKGEYLNGEPEGEWVHFYANGMTRARGEYRYGARNSLWRFFDAAGKVVPEHTGPYVAQLERHPTGRIAMAGEQHRDERHGRWRWWTPEGRLRCEVFYERGKRHGTWRSYWPHDGSPQLFGIYLKEERAGAWTFRHADGSFDSRLLSGQYDRGRRLANVAVPDEQAGSGRRRFGLPIPLSQLPEPSPLPGATARDRLRAEVLVESFRVLDSEARAERLASLVAHGHSVLPAILSALRNLDLSAAADAEFGEFLDGALTAIHRGHSFGWRSGSGLDAALHNENQVLRWSSLWELTRSRPVYLDELATRPVDRPPSTALLAPPILEPARIVDPSPSFALRVSSSARERRRIDSGGTGTADALAAALAALVRAQRPDGSFAAGKSAANGGEALDSSAAIAVTGLVALALIGGGHGEPGAAHAQALRGATHWLVAQQTSEGRFGPTAAPLAQALGTAALAEYLIVSIESDLEPVVQAGLDELVRQQHENGAWHGPFSAVAKDPAEPADTLATAWAINALHACERAGFDRDPRAVRRALAALTRASDPTSGEVAGTIPVPGRPPAQSAEGADGAEATATGPIDAPWRPAPERAATAAALLARFQLGQLPEHVPLMQLGIGRARAALPTLDPQEQDAEAWFFGAHALYQVGGATWKDWAEAQRTAVVGLQHVAPDQPEHGTWSADVSWGPLGNATVTTALAALALEAYFRLPRIPR